MSERPIPLPPPVAVIPAETPPMAALFGLAVAVVVVASLFLARTVLLPIMLAALLSFVLAPLVRVLRRVWLGRIGSVLVAVLGALALVVVLGGLIGTQVATLADDIPRYQHTIERKIGAVESFTTSGLSNLMRRYAHGLISAGQQTPQAPAAAGATGSIITKPTIVQVQPAEPSAWQVAEQVLMPILSPLATAGIIFIVAIFLLLQQEDLRDRMIRLFGSGDLHRTTIAIDEAATRLSRYFLTQLGINAAFGVVIMIGLALIGVPSPILWGVIGGLLRFVPYIGSFIGALLPAALAAAVVPGWTLMIYTVALFVIVESIVGQVVEPMLYGSSTGLSPFAVIVAAIFWSWIWGPIGLIISTPVTLCLVVLGRHVKRLEFLDVLLGDRPALTPIESFYQRMLADDPDEAQALAENLLRDRALSSYYDDVALKGLVLATNDAERGVLGPAGLRRIGTAMAGLIAELADYDDVDPFEASNQDEPANDFLNEDRPPRTLPPPIYSADELQPAWRDGAPVLCIAGRGPLDETAALMLAQLLGKHGLGARVASHEAASRVNIGALDLTGVQMICLIYLNISGTPPNLRYLIARLRRRLPSAPLLVGMWGEGEAVLSDRAQRASLGADFYVQTLRDAILACLDASRQPATVTAAA